MLRPATTLCAGTVSACAAVQWWVWCAGVEDRALLLAGAVAGVAVAATWTAVALARAQRGAATPAR